ncbi:MAG: S41 family peptidase, partial [Planctomycetales bacterium]|nr:S41 family peptidase [Planctomycetales bacterium]
ELRDSVNTRIVRDRRAARDLVYYSARLAQQRLGIPLSATIMEYCCGAIGSLDQYSSYLSGSQLDEVYSQIEGNFVGLGIELKSDQGSLLIVDVIGNGPAALAGIQPGDRIVAVDGKSTEDITTELAADMLKGEQGSVVQVAVLSPANDAPRELSIRRERVDVPSVEDAMMVDKQNGVAYFRLTSFQKTTSRDVDAALWKLHREGMKSLIIDLRGNPGGLLTASVEVSDKFLTEGTIVSTRGRSRQEDFDYTAHRVGTWQVPLVVLIDRDTASASEIFAGAMRDHHRARVVGEQSYGKGSVQGIFPLSVVKSGVRLTTAKFYSPSGQAISGQGVTPDMAVAGSDVTATAHIVGYRGGTPDIVNDNVLAAGCEAARQLTVAQR